MSKSALVRNCVERGLPPHGKNGLRWIGELRPLFDSVEPGDVDTELYGPLEAGS